LDRGEIAAAQRSQILSPDAPLAREKFGLVDAKITPTRRIRWEDIVAGWRNRDTDLLVAATRQVMDVKASVVRAHALPMTPRRSPLIPMCHRVGHIPNSLRFPGIALG
jgi:hypothetical protein